MKSDKTVYCEFGFIKELAREYNKLSRSDWKSIISIRYLLNLLYNSVVCFDVPREKFEDEINSIKEIKDDKKLFQLISRITKNPRIKNSREYPKSNYYSEEYTNCYEILNSIFLTLKNKRQRQEMSSNLGVMVLGKEDIIRFHELFKSDEIPIHINELDFWDKINVEGLRCSNTIIIEDNYILSGNNTNLIKNNLIEILARILPYHTSVPYHISIYAYDIFGNPRETCKLLKKEIEKIRTALDFKLCICKIDKKDFHDRNIFTNNAHIDCKGGFDLIYNKSEGSSKTTTISYSYPYTLLEEDGRSSKKESYLNYISDLLKYENMDLIEDLNYWVAYSDNIKEISSDLYSNRLLVYLSDNKKCLKR